VSELCNGLSIPRALKLFVLADDFRENVALAGVKNGVNTVFTIPGGDLARHEPPGVQIKLYRNGLRQNLGVGCDYTVSESGGAGTGFDTVTVDPAPLSYEILLVDFVAM
jgi:hypothetical protein